MVSVSLCGEFLGSAKHHVDDSRAAIHCGVVFRHDRPRTNLTRKFDFCKIAIMRAWLTLCKYKALFPSRHQISPFDASTTTPTSSARDTWSIFLLMT